MAAIVASHDCKNLPTLARFISFISMPFAVIWLLLFFDCGVIAKYCETAKIKNSKPTMTSRSNNCKIMDVNGITCMPLKKEQRNEVGEDWVGHSHTFSCVLAFMCKYIEYNAKWLCKWKKLWNIQLRTLYSSEICR